MPSQSWLTTSQLTVGACPSADATVKPFAARNTLIGIETLTQDEIEEIRATCAAKARRAVNGARKEANKKIKAAVGKALS